MSNLLKLIIAAAWATLIGVAYFQLYPFAALMQGLPQLHHCNPLSVFGAPLLHLMALLFILFAANGWGVYFWHDQHLRFNEKLTFATGAGLGGLSLSILLANFFGIAGSAFFLLLLFSGAVILIINIPRIYPGNHPHPSWLVWLSIIPVGSALIGALAPPTQFDSLCYHLALPAQYIAAGRIVTVSYNIFFSFPQNAEMLYQLAMTIDNDILANLIHWSFLPLIALSVHTLTVRYLNEKAADAASIIWCATPAVMFLATGTYVDLMLAFYLYLSLHALMLWHTSRHERWLISAGIFLGLALGTKYTAALYAIPLIAMVWYGSRTIREPLIVSTTAGAVFFPWLVKNLIFLRNPIAPWGTGFFASSGITPAQAHTYFTHIQSHGLPSHSWRDILTLPWHLTAYGYTYGGGFDILGPLFLIFIPVLLFTRKSSTMKGLLLSYTAIALLLWFLTGKVLRFLTPALPLLCMFSAEGVMRARELGLHKWVMYTVLAMLLTHNVLFFHWVMASPNPYAPALCGVNRNEYLSVKVNYYHALNEYVNKLPHANVLFIGETRRYYCVQPAIVATAFDNNPFFMWANDAASAGALCNRLRQEHITHLLINQSEFDRLGYDRQLTDSGRAAFAGLKRDYATMEYADKHTQVYRINAPGARS